MQLYVVVWHDDIPVKKTDHTMYWVVFKIQKHYL